MGRHNTPQLWTRQLMNELMKLDLDQLPSTQLGSDEMYKEMAKGGGFLGYIKLTNNDDYVKDEKIGNGHFGIPKGKDEIIDLGKAIDVIPLARRPKAMDAHDKSAIIVSYDETSQTFKDIQERSNINNSKCGWGTSFLVLERRTGRFLEFFFGTKSSRPEAANMFPPLPLPQADIDRRAAAGADVKGLEPHGPLPMTLTSTLARNKKGSWFTPVATKCSAPFAKLPSTKEVVEEIKKFLTIQSDGAEPVKETRKERAR
jgi:hypothetical protein